MRTKYTILSMIIVISGYFIFSGFIRPGDPKKHFIRINNPAELKKFFQYSSDSIPFVSSHRGGPRVGFPENCLPTFENTLERTWSIIETDPRFTKDSAIVLMHDATLDRTSTGTGKVTDYTLEEIKKLRLKDTEGNITAIGIPTLDEALEWAKGKTILVIDAKDVPAEVRARKIIEHHAETNAILIAYSYEDAKKVYAISKNIMMEVMVPDESKVRSFDSTGVSWSNIVAFVTHTQPTDPGIFKMIHDKGAMCIVGSSRTIDKKFIKSPTKDTAALKDGYHAIINSGADIIEADLGIEAGETLSGLKKTKSRKAGFFRLEK